MIIRLVKLGLANLICISVVAVRLCSLHVVWKEKKTKSALFTEIELKSDN